MATDIDTYQASILLDDGPGRYADGIKSSQA
jgi:hypothetical protein